MDVTCPTLSKEIIILDTHESETPNETPPMLEEGELEVHQEEPIISLHDLACIYAP